MIRRILIAGVIVLVVAFAWVNLSKKKDQLVVEQQETNSEPNSELNAGKLYDQALVMKKNGEFVNAQNSYRKLIKEYPDHENIDIIQKEYENLSMQIIFSNTPTENTIIHEVVSGDSLGKLAKKYNTTIELIKISNSLKSDIIRIGQKLRIWTAPFDIFVDKSQNVLMLKTGERVVKVYNVSTGSNNSTPVGEFTVTTKLTDPVWFNRGVVVPPESPENVLGSRWLGFDLPGYGIHGTVEPDTIGKQVTAGCVRMRNEEVEELYSIIPFGTKVVIAN
ncbi:MAG: L,D-transpeptidase family protein [Candidatus Omnitrophica bacterium]|nr:L,D-transpeptidase family protein [Candidatus Omnitrophota bacterium]MBU1997270.1 L,D-transpeptidase family protein [Candidatus Omnitrophota bacterium]